MSGVNVSELLVSGVILRIPSLKSSFSLNFSKTSSRYLILSVSLEICLSNSSKLSLLSLEWTSPWIDLILLLCSSIRLLFSF